MHEVIIMSLLQIKTRGIKNITKDFCVSFSNLTIDKGIKNINQIKGIYGYNGAGKTAFITSVELYKKLFADADYLLSNSNQIKLNKLINKSIKEFFIEFIFSSDSENTDIYKHSILLSFDNIENKYKISQEYFGKIKGRTLKESDCFEICSIKNSILKTNIDIDEYLNLYLIDAIGQSNGNLCLISAFLKCLTKRFTLSKKTFDDGKIQSFLELFVFNLSLTTYLLNDDKHERKSISKNAIEKIRSLAETKQLKDLVNYDEFYEDEEFEEKVFRYDLPELEEQNKKLENFIKIFKPELKKIILDKKIENETVHCRRIFDYGKKLQIDIEYESSGIKHLVQLHKYLQSYISGKIVFIDEMDVNINSVFLCKLLEFLTKVGKGQLCFTSHNLEPMNSIKNIKASICAIGYNGILDVWVKNGNKSPSNEYIKGEFEHSPFNVESFDFYSCFDLSKK